MVPPTPKRSRKEDKPRTRAGCWNCRSRRKRCDQGRPNCAECSRLGLTCEGYGVRLKWDVDVTTRGKIQDDSHLPLSAEDPAESQAEGSANDLKEEARTPAKEISRMLSVEIEDELFGDCKSAPHDMSLAAPLNGCVQAADSTQSLQKASSR